MRATTSSICVSINKHIPNTVVRAVGSCRNAVLFSKFVRIINIMNTNRTKIIPDRNVCAFIGANTVDIKKKQKQNYSPEIQ